MRSTGSVSDGLREDRRKLRSSIITEAQEPGPMTRLPTHRPPTHPGEMLRVEFLIPLGMTQSELARRISVSYPRVNEIVNGRRGISPDTALRLARLFGTSPEFWLNGQLNWDLWHALRSPDAADLEAIEPIAV
jgi:addiction module HigA family antidote